MGKISALIIFCIAVGWMVIGFVNFYKAYKKNNAFTGESILSLITFVILPGFFGLIAALIGFLASQNW